MFLMWLGEQITERGLGNGISILIFAGIAAGLPQRDRRTARAGAHRRDDILIGAVHHRRWSSLVTCFVVFVERGQRKILVNYAKRQVGNKVYGGQTSHLPLKLNMAGVIPPIFASSIILFPATLVQLVRHRREHALAAATSPATLAPGPADLRDAVRRRRSSSSASSTRRCVYNTEGDGRQPEEERRLHPGHPSGRADGALHREDPDAPDAGRRGLHHVGVPAARSS